MPEQHFNLADMLEQVCDAVPERTALVCGDHRATFGELEKRANKLAHFLQSKGVAAGDHVGLYMFNCAEYLEAMVACFKIRAVPINVNYRYVKDELLYIFDNADMVACVHHREFTPHIAEVRDAAKDLKLFIAVDDASSEDIRAIDSVNYEAAMDEQSDVRDFDERADDDYFVLYTGGTTGMPKGVMWPHKNVFFAAMGGGGHFSPHGPCEKPTDIVSRITENQIVGMALAPLMHGASWWYACIQLLAGNAVILNPDHSFNAENILTICEQEKVNAIQIVGDAMAIPVVDALDANPDRWDLSGIFSVGSGGAVFSEAKQDAFKKHFPNVFITNSFGSSESGAMGMDSGAKRGQAGLGNVAKSEFMDVIVEEDGKHRHGKVGEMGIFARSGYIPKGYYNAPKKTAETFVPVDGQTWLLTGDEAILEEDNSITVYGRGSNCINSGGEKIFPEEVEDALKGHPDIFDALVVATADDRFGSKVTAVVSARSEGSLSLASVQDHCRNHIAGYKVPRALHVIDEVPRAPSGKPDYKTAKTFAESGAGEVA